jgi:predicted NBD/HSP70 family sugar kinase
MIQVAIVTRRLKEGKTYEDFRKAWYHTTGFGTSSKLYTMINAFDPREIIVVGFVETNLEDLLSKLRIDVKERLANPLDDVIEPQISRKFGILISEDDFSADGAIDYKPAAIGGKETNLEEISNNLSEIAAAIAQASAERDLAKD